MSKEAYLCGKRGLLPLVCTAYLCGKSGQFAISVYGVERTRAMVKVCVCVGRGLCMAKEAYVWQKRPMYGKRGLFTWQKRPIYGKRGLSMAKGPESMMPSSRPRSTDARDVLRPQQLPSFSTFTLCVCVRVCVCVWKRAHVYT